MQQESFNHHHQIQMWCTFYVPTFYECGSFAKQKQGEHMYVTHRQWLYPQGRNICIECVAASVPLLNITFLLRSSTPPRGQSLKYPGQYWSNHSPLFRILTLVSYWTTDVPFFQNLPYPPLSLVGIKVYFMFNKNVKCVVKCDRVSKLFGWTSQV